VLVTSLMLTLRAHRARFAGAAGSRVHRYAGSKDQDPAYGVPAGDHA
jgi:hypothetical protein